MLSQIFNTSFIRALQSQWAQPADIALGPLHDRIYNRLESLTQHPGKNGTTHIATQGHSPSLIHAERSGPDEQWRAPLVNLQADLESLITEQLKSGEILAAVGVIHTPNPATPLRSDGQTIPSFIDPDIAHDPARLDTVMKRPNILRSYLNAGGRLITLYPDSALTPPPAGMEHLHRLTQQYPQLDNYPVPTWPDQLTGATYLTLNNQGQLKLFSLHAHQAHNTEGKDWGIWYGGLEHEPIRTRLETVHQALSERGVSLFNELGGNLLTRLKDRATLWEATQENLRPSALGLAA